MPVPGGKRSFSAWLRSLFHTCIYWGCRPYFVNHHHCSNASSTPRCCPWYGCGGINTLRFHFSIGHRVDHPSGRKERSVGIVPFVPACEPATPHRWSHFPGICKTRRTTCRKVLWSYSTNILIVQEMLFWCEFVRPAQIGLFT